MADNLGYILLHRCLLDSAVWNDGEKHNRKSAWVDLMLKVNHTDKKLMVNGSEIVVRRGQRLTSIAKLAIEWGVTRKTAKRWIDSWKAAGMVYVDSTTRYTLITILKYSIYQDGKRFKGQVVPNSIPNSVSDSIPSSVPPEYPQTKNEKNVNNEKEGKERKPKPPRDGTQWQ